MFYQTSPYLVLNTQEKADIITDLIKNTDIPINGRVWSLLRFCQEEKSKEDILNTNSIEDFSYAVNNQLILNCEEMWSYHSISLAEIEINTHCNFRCRYCPVHTEPKQKKIMTLDIYEMLLYKLTKVPSLQFVSFNFYNEPTLDPNIYKRIDMLSSTHLKLILNTNASHLTQQLIEKLFASGVVEQININFPSLNKQRFEYLTGSSLYELCLQNVVNCAKHSLPVRIVVNENLSGKDQKEIDNFFKSIHQDIGVVFNFTHSRANHVKDLSYKRGYCTKLYGCKQILKEIVIRHNGDILLCCMDYNQEYKVGNLIDQNVNEIFSGDHYLSTKKRIYGSGRDDDQFLCHKCAMMLSAKYHKGIMRKKLKQV